MYIGDYARTKSEKTCTYAYYSFYWSFNDFIKLVSLSKMAQVKMAQVGK